MSNSVGRKIYSIHKWCGLIAGIVIFILGISGAILVFHNELDSLEHLDVWTIKNSKQVSIDKAYHTINERYKEWDIRLQRFSNNPSETFIFNLRQPVDRLTVFVHPSTGAILKEIDTSKTFVNWVLTLHYQLHSGLIGEILILLFGVIYLISLITGIIIYRKAVLDMLLFRIKFRHKNKRTIASSLHRYIGVWALVLNLLIVLSGIVISYEVVSYAIRSNSANNVTVQSPEITFSIDQVLKILQAEHPEFKPSYIRFPTNNEKPLIVNGDIEGQTSLYSKFYNSVSINNEGEIAGLQMASSAAASTQLSSIVRGIHFVEFGNLPIKLLFFLAALSAPTMSITGFFLWKWKHRRNRSRAIRKARVI